MVKISEIEEHKAKHSRKKLTAKNETGEDTDDRQSHKRAEYEKYVKYFGHASTELDKDLRKPGNRDYLSYYNHQGGWRPTRPLKSVAATNTGPGPAIVNLPTAIGDHEHDPRKSKAPAYKIGERDMTQYFNCAPSSATYNTRTLTNKGKDVCHAPKIGEKISGLKTFMSPGPAVHQRGDSDDFVYPNSPAYTMQFYHDFTKPFSGPAPDKYTLPDTISLGKSPYAGGPAFTIGERLDQTGTLKPNPGPAAYQLPTTNVNKQKPPAYSMGSRTMSSNTGTGTPGPASNDLHLVKFHKPSTPRFTFGVRHSPFKAFQAFSPGD